MATVGYPGAWAEIIGSDSLSRGTVSKLFSLGAIQVIQTDAPVNPGNSGGALIDECGAVVGVVVRKAVDVQVEGIAYATTAASAQRALQGASSR